MSSSENLLKAAFNRISVRLGKGLFDTATNLSKKVQETPDQIKAEWELLKEEIINEADQLDNNFQEDSDQKSNSQISQRKIDSIRAKISMLIDKVEDRN